MRYEIDEKTLRLFAELIAGLQAPRGMAMLGRGTEPFDQLHGGVLNLFGYPSADEVEARMKECFKPSVAASVQVDGAATPGGRKGIMRDLRAAATSKKKRKAR